MKLPRPIATSVALAAASALGACHTTPEPYDNHWNVGSLGPRMAYYGLGYNPVLADTYRDSQWQDKQDINLTLRRHFLNNNPENPFEPEDTSLSDPRPPHSVVPDPVQYFHLESIFFGLGFSALTGTFIPIPVGSVLGTLEEGGGEEFSQGIKQTASGNFRGTLAEPPKPEEFRVRNARL
jgi:hypothetical protein